MGLVVDHELEMTEVRVRQLDAVVDLFVILESNVTAGNIHLSQGGISVINILQRKQFDQICRNFATLANSLARFND